MLFAGELAALGTAACWASGANLFAAAGRRIGPSALNRLRLAMAFVMLSAALFAWHGTPFPTSATSFQLIVLSASGLVGFVFGDAYYFRALVILGPGRATLVASLSPFFTLLLAWPVLGERPGLVSFLGVAVTVAGVAWVVSQRAAPSAAPAVGSLAAGIAAGVAGSLGQAGGYVLSKIALETGIDALPATVVRVGAATVAVWLFALLAREAKQNLSALRDPAAVAFTAGGAFMGPFLGVTLSLVALQHIEAGVAAAITAIYPIPTLLLAARFHGEALTARALAGTSLAVAGVVLLFLR